MFLVVAMPSEKNKVSEASKSKGKAMSFANSTLEFRCNIENFSFNRVKSTVNPIITTASGNNSKSSNNSTKDGSSSACHRYVRVYIFVLFSHFNDYDMSK